MTAGTSLDPTTNSATSNNGTEGNRQNSFVGQFNSFFTPTLINEFRGQYSREDRPRIPNVISPLVDNGIGLFGTVSFLPTTQYDTRVQLNDNVTKNHGAHSFKFGTDYNRTFANQVFAFRQTGNFSFQNLGTDTTSLDRKSTRLNSSHGGISRMPSSA